jgi:integrase
MHPTRFTPIPLFDTHAAFTRSSELEYEDDRPFLRRYMDGFQSKFDARADYYAVRKFLKSNSRVETTFNNYRTQVERLLLWAWVKRGKSILQFLRSDVEDFMDFCCNPDPAWIGTSIKSRFILVQGVYEPNPEWRPFTMRTAKATRKVAAEHNREAPTPSFSMAAGSIRQVYAAINSLFHYCVCDMQMGNNPCAQLGKNKEKWVGRDLRVVTSKSLTKLQWDFVLDTAELMAGETPQGERTLFCIVMMLSCYLRISDLVGNGKWKPTMGSFQKTENGWWYHVVGKGNVQDKIAVKPDCIEYLKRYRNWLGLTDYPYPGETEPLLRTARGRAGLTARQVRNDVQQVFDRAIQRMRDDNFSEEETAALRSATLHWFRHTGATFDAPFRNPKHLQADMRHKSLATTQNIYYNTLDDERASEVANLSIRR